MSYQVGDGTNAIMLSDSSGGNIAVGTINGFNALSTAQSASRVYDDLTLNRTVLSDVLDPTAWMTDSTTAPRLSQTATATIGDYVYMFGGYDHDATAGTDKIYRASVSNMSTWTDTGATLPAADFGFDPIVTGGYLYLFSGDNNFAYRAPISSPLSWSIFISGYNNVAEGNPWGRMLLSGNYLYKIGGFNEQGVYRAPLSNLSSWGNSGGFGGALNWGQGMFVIGDYLYMFGGSTSNSAPTNGIYRALLSDINGSISGIGSLPISTICPSVVAIGDYAYMLGTSNGVIYRASLLDLTSWSAVSNMPTSYQAKVVAVGDKLYSFGGASNIAQHCRTSAWTGRNYFQLNYGAGPRLYDSTGAFSLMDSSGISYADATVNNMTVGGGGYNNGHLLLGNYHLWMDSTGNLRVMNGAPGFDSDGTVVGSQS